MHMCLKKWIEHHRQTSLFLRSMRKPPNVQSDLRTSKLLADTRELCRRAESRSQQLADQSSIFFAPRRKDSVAHEFTHHSPDNKRNATKAQQHLRERPVTREAEASFLWTQALSASEHPRTRAQPPTPVLVSDACAADKRLWDLVSQPRTSCVPPSLEEPQQISSKTQRAANRVSRPCTRTSTVSFKKHI